GESRLGRPESLAVGVRPSRRQVLERSERVESPHAIGSVRAEADVVDRRPHLQQVRPAGDGHRFRRLQTGLRTVAVALPGATEADEPGDDNSGSGGVTGSEPYISPSCLQ